MAIITLTEENFETEVLKSDKPVLIDFWATWCGPCKMQSPVVDALAEELDGKVVFGKVDVDDQDELAAKFGIQSIPTLVVMKNGQAVAGAVGFQPKENLLALIAKAE
ncbi:MAG: thioredoxin [Faecalicoccus sp.]|nr:thioredoxin [Faecalicoccus sp.]